MTNVAVIGLGFGDEGKGVATNYLCSQHPEDTLVVRFSGGQQAAHTVHHEGKVHIFHHFGSGTLVGCPTYWSKYCTFSPTVLAHEYAELTSKGVTPKIYVSPECLVTTPWEMFPAEDSEVMKHGTTGHGIFATKQRSRELPITVEDLYRKNPYELMDQVRDYYNEEAESVISIWFATSVETMKNAIIVTDKIPESKHIVFEGSQGLLLNEHIGWMPHCTPSDITPRPILEMGYSLDEVYLITRSYQTRHGKGPMTNEELPIELINTETETCKKNEFQGSLRTSILDLDLLLHAKVLGVEEVIPNVKTNLIVTCMDQLTRYDFTEIGFVNTSKDSKGFLLDIGDVLGITGSIYKNTSPQSKTIDKVFENRYR